MSATWIGLDFHVRGQTFNRCSAPSPVRLIAQSAETLFCNIDVLSETVLWLSIEIVAGSAKSTIEREPLDVAR